MNYTPIKVSAPGSIMITGEHAVVYGQPSIVCAIDQRVTVEALPLTERRVEIVSDIAPPVTLPLDVISGDGPYRFILSAVELFAGRLKHGVRLTVSSKIDPSLGLGSSAAVTIASLGALATMLGDRLGLLLHTRALAIIRRHQKRGSGADLAASVFGGMIAYKLPTELLNKVPAAETSAKITPLPTPPILSLCYSGNKTPTSAVLAKVARSMVGREEEFAALYERMGRVVRDSIAFARVRNWPAFGDTLSEYQGMMEELDVSDPTLERMIDNALACPKTLGAKISGSGLGDCVLAVGAVPSNFFQAPVTSKGLHVYA
ncbi:putative mevalonate kinase [Rhodobacteraceae bacterium KLH11]|nr:putative mevalonate kinase [Rhodobacteraceae bacterium KLH11]